MNFYNTFLPLWTLISLVHGQIQVPTTAAGILEHQDFLLHLLELKFSVESLSGAIRTLDTWVGNIENLVTETEGRFKELSSQVTQDILESQSQEQMLCSNLNSLENRINLTIILNPGLETSVAEIRSQTQAMLDESREERANSSAVAPPDVNVHCRSVMQAVTSHLEDIEDGNARKDRMWKGPEAKFYEGENRTGKAVVHDLTASINHAGCYNVGEETIQSMDLSEFCARVFQHDSCRGLSHALYPKPKSGSFINFLTSDLPSVQSVGPCLYNEFLYATISPKGARTEVTKDESHIHQVPDFVDFSGEDAYLSKSTSVDSPTNPIVRYYMEEGRPKWIWAEIRGHHGKSSEREEGRNLAIPPALGGPKDEVYNTFPQSQSSFETWNEIIEQIETYLYAFHLVSVSVTFKYESYSMDKPYGFYYWVKHAYYDEGSNHSFYGFVEN